MRSNWMSVGRYDDIMRAERVLGVDTAAVEAG
jgi:hypothetical protein